MEKKDKMKILILDDEKQFTEELSGFFLSSDVESMKLPAASSGVS